MTLCYTSDDSTESDSDFGDSSVVTEVLQPPQLERNDSLKPKIANDTLPSQNLELVPLSCLLGDPSVDSNGINLPQVPDRSSVNSVSDSKSSEYGVPKSKNNLRPILPKPKPEISNPGEPMEDESNDPLFVEKEVEVWQCDLCSRTSTTKSGLTLHMQRYHDIQMKATDKHAKKVHASDINSDLEIFSLESDNWECDHCGRKYKTKTALKKHKRIHEPPIQIKPPLPSKKYILSQEEKQALISKYKSKVEKKTKEIEQAKKEHLSKVKEATKVTLEVNDKFNVIFTPKNVTATKRRQKPKPFGNLLLKETELQVASRSQNQLIPNQPEFVVPQPVISDGIEKENNEESDFDEIDIKEEILDDQIELENSEEMLKEPSKDPLKEPMDVDEKESEQPKFACNQCSTLCFTRKGFNHHVNAKHQGRFPEPLKQPFDLIEKKVQKTGMWKCTQCTTRCITKQGLALHFDAKHAQKPKPKCQYCDSEFSSLTYLENHITRHHKKARALAMAEQEKKYKTKVENYAAGVELAHKTKVEEKAKPAKKPRSRPLIFQKKR